jgi:hypothetical protein
MKSLLGSIFLIYNSDTIVLSSQFSVLSSQFSVLSSQFSVHSSQFTVLSSQFTVYSRFDKAHRPVQPGLKGPDRGVHQRPESTVGSLKFKAVQSCCHSVVIQSSFVLRTSFNRHLCFARHSIVICASHVIHWSFMVICFATFMVIQLSFARLAEAIRTGAAHVIQ